MRTSYAGQVAAAPTGRVAAAPTGQVAAAPTGHVAAAPHAAPERPLMLLPAPPVGSGVADLAGLSTVSPSARACPGDEDTVAAGSHSATSARYLSRPVALVGFMGVGKTSVGRELARLLGRPFVDTDAMVEERAGCSIPELFAQGEPVFRGLERQATLDALEAPPSVIALGGGAFSQPGAGALLLDRALVVHLYMPWTVVRSYLGDLAADRPLLRGRPHWEVQDLFLRRCADYRRAHLRVVLPRRDAAEAAALVAAVVSRPVGPR